LTGDRHRIVQFADDRVAVLELAGKEFSVAAIHEGRIDAWNLRPIDDRTAGRFSQGEVDVIVVRSDNWIGLLAWDSGARRLRLRSIQEDRVDGWNLAVGDQHIVGDFDGDGLDEVFIRSARWAGMLKWSTDRFQLKWIVEDAIEHWLGDDRPSGQPTSLRLDADDHIHTARLFSDQLRRLTRSLVSNHAVAERWSRTPGSPFRGIDRVARRC
jgi:hypothetical protein